MEFKLTSEQQEILDTAISLPEGSLLKVEAVAGASKTYTSVELAKLLSHGNSLYLAYNKSISVEAATKFPSSVQCKTTHSLAYQPIISLGLDSEGETGKKRIIAEKFNYRSIKEDISYEAKVSIIQIIERFCVSKYDTIPDFLEATGIKLHQLITDLCVSYFQQMIDKEIPVTHAFYLKYFQLSLAMEHIHYDKPFDLLILDEAGDINEVTLEIFLLLPAKLKVMVGDSLQNIYSFNHTINGFKALQDVGVTKHLTQSFRCSEEIAKRIETFIRMHIDPTVVFRGTAHADTSINTKAILSRTNSGLISYIIDLAEAEIVFNTIRPVKELFGTMLVLINLKPGCKIYDPSLKFLIKDLNIYNKSTQLKARYKTVLGYIKAVHGSEDPDIETAIGTIFKYGAGNIYKAYKYAQDCESHKEKHELTLSTAHSSKGYTFDAVELANDFNLVKILETSSSERFPEEVEELRLYYVAASRARVKLSNAIYLDVY